RPWPPPAVTIADRPYFQTFKSGLQSPLVLVEPVHSRITGAWTTVLARKLIGTDGEFLGVIGRGIEPVHFEKFFASVALGEDAAIAMYHRDGTLLARYPHADEMIGRNFASGPLFERILSAADHGTTRISSPADGQERLGSVRELTNFPIVMVATTTV